MLTSPILLFLIVHVMFPESPYGADLREYYYEHRRLIWPLGAAATVVGTVFKPIAFGDSLLTEGNLATPVVFAICVALAWSGNRKLHAVLVPAVLVVLVLDVVLVDYLLAG